MNDGTNNHNIKRGGQTYFRKLRTSDYVVLENLGNLISLDVSK